MELYRRRIEGRSMTENASRIRLSDDIERRVRLAGLRAERDTIFQLARNHALADESSRKLVREIDLAEERLK
jgi:CPA1 family monovalent cation:H+ antiporter